MAKSSSGDQDLNADQDVAIERPSPSGWVVTKTAEEASMEPAPGSSRPVARTATTGKPAAAAKKRSSTKRELIDTGRNKMFAKRGAKGRFKEMDDVSRSLSADRRQKAKTRSKSGHGDQGDGARATAGGKKTASKGGKKTAGNKKTAGTKKTAGNKPAAKRTSGKKTSGKKKKTTRR